MSVRIELEDPPAIYTNLDFVSGRVILSLSSDETISAILVKLEGESKTSLSRPLDSQAEITSARQNQRRGIAVENHKILYKVNQVFPNTNPHTGTTGSAYTLRAGQYEYPFRFKIPLNNGCPDARWQGMGSGSGFGRLATEGLELLEYQHVKKTLPPSVIWGGWAVIRYYIKVTVQRPSIFKGNTRTAIDVYFIPIEPPRPPKTTNEEFARRPYDFQAGLASYVKQTSLFKKKPTQSSRTAPKGEIEARLPSPAILTCHQPIPLRLIAHKLNDSPEQVFLMSLDILLIGHGEFRAADVTMSKSNEGTSSMDFTVKGLPIPIGKPDDEVGTETVLNAELWKMPLPDSVLPSFITCNQKMWYELEIRVGLGYGLPKEIQVCSRSFAQFRASETNEKFLTDSYFHSRKSLRSPSASASKFTLESHHLQRS